MSENNEYRIITTSNKIITYVEDGIKWTRHPEGSFSAACRVYDGNPATIIFDSCVSGRVHNIYADSLPLYAHRTLINEGEETVTLRGARSGSQTGSLYSQGDVTLGARINLDIDLEMYGQRYSMSEDWQPVTLTLNGNTIGGTIMLRNGSKIVGEGVTFTNQQPFVLCMNEWDGSAAELHACLKEQIPDWDSCTFTANAPILNIEANITEDTCIDEAWKTSLLPKGFSEVHVNLNIKNGSTVTIAEGTSLITYGEGTFILDDTTLSVSHGTLKINPDVKLSQGTKQGTKIACHGTFAYNPDTGNIELAQQGLVHIDGVDITGCEIYVGRGNLTLENCWGKATLELGHEDYTEPSDISITHCDLSRVTIYTNNPRHTYDFSDNYWGTTNLETIKHKFKRYDWDLGKYVYVGDEYFEGENPHILLGTPRTTAPQAAPALVLKKPTITKTANGLIDIGFEWTGEAGAHYTLLMDGTPVSMEDDTLTSHTFRNWSDGAHTLTVTATDRENDTTTKSYSFSVDATAPAVPVLAGSPTISNRKKGKAGVVFNWANEHNEKGARYTVTLRRADGWEKKIYSGSKTACSYTLREGEYTYTITASDKAGNESVLTGEGCRLSFDATAPALTLNKEAPARPTPIINTGRGSVTFNWQCEDASTVTFTLTLDKASPLTLTPTLNADGSYSYTLTDVADGKHSYALTATDAEGNSSTKKGSFSFDSTAPALSLNTHKTKLNKKGELEATLSWKGEKGATYILFMEGHDPMDMGTKTGYKCRLEEGVYSYYVVATDKAGNTTTSETRTLEYDATAPAISALNHTMQLTDGKAATTISWECRETATPAEKLIFTVKVDGKTIRNAEVMYDANTGRYSYTHTSPLKSGSHSYSITAMDWAGNKMTATSARGSFVTPRLSLSKANVSEGDVNGDGLINATLKWNVVAGATYTLTLDGVEQGTLTIPDGCKSYTHELTGIRDGAHSYRVTALNAGHYTVAEGSFTLDDTPPATILSNISNISGSSVTSKGRTYGKATLQWSGEEGVSYTVRLTGSDGKARKIYSGKKLSVTTGKLEAGSYLYSITAKDKAGNVAEALTGSFSISTEGGTAELEWAGGTPARPTDFQRISWGNTDNDGINSEEGHPATYRFELETARQLLVKLGDLVEDATVILQQEGGQGIITLSANAATGLDRELSLSAGSYWLQVLGSDGESALAGSYTLDLELKKNGSKQPMQQGVLA